MRNELAGRKIAFLVANEGAEEIELTSPMQAARQAGAETVLLAPKRDVVQCFKRLDKAATLMADHAVREVRAEDFDALMLPGGVANPDRLRMDDDAVAFVAAFARLRKPIAVICHGPWTLIEAGVVDGRMLASWPSLKTDIKNAGGRWRDEQVVVCQAQAPTLVSARKPDDLPAFNAKMIEVFQAETAASHAA